LFELLFVGLPFFLFLLQVFFIESYYIINHNIRNVTYNKHTKAQEKAPLDNISEQLNALFMEKNLFLYREQSQKGTVQQNNHKLKITNEKLKLRPHSLEETLDTLHVIPEH